VSIAKAAAREQPIAGLIEEYQPLVDIRMNSSARRCAARALAAAFRGFVRTEPDEIERRFNTATGMSGKRASLIALMAIRANAPGR